MYSCYRSIQFVIARFQGLYEKMPLYDTGGRRTTVLRQALCRHNGAQLATGRICVPSVIQYMKIILPSSTSRT